MPVMNKNRIDCTIEGIKDGINKIKNLPFVKNVDFSKDKSNNASDLFLFVDVDNYSGYNISLINDIISEIELNSFKETGEFITIDWDWKKSQD